MRRIMPVILLVALLTNLLPPRTASAQNIFEGRIAYTDNLGNLWVLDGATGQSTQITFDADPGSMDADEYHSIGYHSPQFSPDGRLLLYNRLESTTSDYQVDIQLLNLETQAIESLPEGMASPVWSPDGRAILYGKGIQFTEDYNFKDPSGIWQYDLGGRTEVEMIPCFGGNPLMYPSPSPDGQHILFHEAQGMEGLGALWVWDRATGSITHLESSSGTGGSAAWLPDNTIVFDEITYAYFMGAGIYRANADGSNVSPLIMDPASALANPLPSPDGRWISVNVGSEDMGSIPYLLLFTVDRGNSSIIYADMALSWSPDGTELLVLHEGQLKIVDVQTNETIIISGSAGYNGDWGPAPTALPISPDGTPVDLSPWISEKHVLIDRLENITIKTSLFSIPAFAGLNEQPARHMLDLIEQQNGQVSPEEADAFVRLVLQERSLAGHLELMADTIASQSDVMVSSGKTVLGFRYTLNTAWKLCRNKLAFCSPALQRQVDKLIWKVVKGTGLVFIPLMKEITGDDQSAKAAWEVAVTAMENELNAGATLQDLLVDSTIEAALTRALLEKYLERDQAMLDRGFSTLGLNGNAPDRWYSISGDVTRAELMVKEMTMLAQNQHDLVESRHEDFRRGANFAQLSSDISALLTLSPAVFFAKTVSIVTGVEKLLVDMVELTLNGGVLDCMDYLNEKGAEYAFDAQQTPSGCSDRGLNSPTAPVTGLVAYRASVFNHPLKAQLYQDASAYQEAVNDFAATFNNGSEEDIEAALNRLMIEQDRLVLSLDGLYTFIDQKNELSREDAAFISQTNRFFMDSVLLYLAAAQIAQEQQEGKPAGPIGEYASTHLQQLEAVQEAAAALTLPPVSQALPQIVIDEVALEGTGQIRLTVQNIGEGRASGLTAVARTAEGGAISTALPDLAAGELAALILDHPAIGGAVIVEVRQSDSLVDEWMGSLGAAQGQSDPAGQGKTGQQGGIPCFGSISFAAMAASMAIMHHRKGKRQAYE